MKSAKVKLTNRDAQAFLLLFEPIAYIAEQLEKQLLILGGQPVYDREGVLFLDGATERSKRCNGDHNLEGACSRFYHAFCQSPRACVTAILGGRKTTDAPKGGRPSTKKKSKEEKRAEAQFIADRDLLEANGILPFKVDTRNIDLTIGGYKYAILKSIHQRIDSYEKQKISTLADYNELTQKVNDAQSALVEAYTEKEVEALNEFLGKLIAAKWSASWKFRQFVEQNLGNLANATSYVNIKGKKKTYECPQNIVDLVTSYPILTNGEKPILFSNRLNDYIELVEKHKAKKKVPSYTKLDLYTFKLMLGKNNVGFSMTKAGEGIVFTINKPNGGTLQFATSIKRYRRGRNFYLQNLDFREGTSSDELCDDKDMKGTYHMTFQRNGKYPVSGWVKEPFIVVQEGGVYVNLCINPDVDEDLYKERWEICKTFLRAYPPKLRNSKQRSLSSSSDEEIKLFKSLKRPAKIVAVDLGLARSGAVVASYKGKNIEIGEEILIEGDASERKDYYDLMRKLDQLQDQIFLTKKLYKNPEDTSLDLPPDYRQWVLGVMPTIPLHKLKDRASGWSVSQQFTSLRKEFIALISKRTKGYDWRNSPVWAMLIKRFISLHRSYNFCGVETDLTNRADICKKYQDNYSNCKRDFEKKLASCIIQFALRNKCDGIVVERLNNHYSKSVNSTDENELHLSWTPGQVKTHLENMSKDEGMFYAEVDERDSSQVSFETQTFGYRDSKNRSILHYRTADGTVKQTHTEINAPKVLAQRFFSRHTNIYSFCVSKNAKGVFTPAYKDEAKRLKGAITRTFGSVNISFDLPESTRETERLFKVNNKWVLGPEKEKYIEGIKSDVARGRMVPHQP